MKPEQRRKVVAIPCITMLLLLGLVWIGCGSKSVTSGVNENYNTTVGYASADTAAVAEASEGATNDITSEQSGASVKVEQGDSDRKLIKTASITAQTREFDAFLNTVSEKVTELGGYIEHSDISGNSYNATYDSSGYTSSRYASYTIRIPAEKLDAFITQVETQATVTSKSENIDDVTLSYVDVQSHITALRTEQESLLAMLEKADTIDAIIAIQSRLTDVRYQLESYESQLRTYDNQIDYSTVNLDVSEVEREVTVDDSFGSRLKEQFTKSLYGIKTAAVDCTIWFVGSLPVLLLLAAVGLLLFLLIRHLIRKSEKKHAYDQQKAERRFHRESEQQTDGQNEEQNNHQNLDQNNNQTPESNNHQNLDQNFDSNRAQTGGMNGDQSRDPDVNVDQRAAENTDMDRKDHNPEV